MKKHGFTITAALLCFINSTHAAEKNGQDYGAWGFDLQGMNTAVKPGDDFYSYANGSWAAKETIPPDHSSHGPFTILSDASEERVGNIIQTWATRIDIQSADAAKVGALYRTFMDEQKIEELKSKPLLPYLKEIEQAQSHNDIVKLMARTHYDFGKSIFAAYISIDIKNPQQYTVYLSQAGLGLPDRDYYLSDNFKDKKARYTEHIATMLSLIGASDTNAAALKIVEFETKIAEAQWSRSESRNVDKTYNLVTLAELEQLAPEFAWEYFFLKAGLGAARRFVVKQNTAFPKLAKIFSETPLETLQAWLTFAIVNEAAPYLSTSFVNANWEFSKFMSGAKEQRDRWKRGVALCEGTMGEAIGKAYVAQYFPPESKAHMEHLVANLLTALKARLEKLPWMSDQTKMQALEKLKTFNVKIGYPSKWQDYSTLEVVEGDLVGNVVRSHQFDWSIDLMRLGKPVDRQEWGMTPQTVNAYYMPVFNEIVFPAAILQPPFFNPDADPAINYGGIGAVIGHEITHGFDDQGRKYDGTGTLHDWWQEQDAQLFNSETAKLGAQYQAIQFADMPNLHINPTLTMGENIADLGGILLAFDAYKLAYPKAPLRDGYSGEQRVFLGWAQVWRKLMHLERKEQLLVSDPHSPSDVRAYATLRNVDAWYDAFGVKQGDALYIKPEDRVRIW